MTRALIVYDSKYGNTKRVAEVIAEGMREVGQVEAILSHVKELDFEKISEYDLVLIGSPNHIGRPTRSVKKLIDKLGELDLKEKRIAVFDTYMSKDFEKAVKKMEKGIGKKIPGSELMAPGLSIRVQAIKGPILDGELPKCREFGRKVATKIVTT